MFEFEFPVKNCIYTLGIKRALWLLKFNLANLYFWADFHKRSKVFYLKFQCSFHINIKKNLYHEKNRLVIRQDEAFI